ncbi:MAG: hypothetical protein HKN91_05025 [Acidimicrobiia bacterium]|nr:hypothetical protein [Acidimicrobiia bacterium]
MPDVPSAPPALGPYSAITEANGFVFISGQVALDIATGDRISGDVATQAEQVMRNISAMLNDLGLTFEDVVKTTIFLADIGDFGAVNAVYARYIGDAKPARSTFQAGGLPGGFLVEIEMIAAR